MNTLPSKKAGEFVDLLRRSAVNLRNGRRDRRVKAIKGSKPLFEVRLDQTHTGILSRENDLIEVAAILAKD